MAAHAFIWGRAVINPGKYLVRVHVQKGKGNARDATAALKDVEYVGHGSGTPGTMTTKPAAGGGACTCPHHPEVVSDQPGKCPECGMKLSAKK